MPISPYYKPAVPQYTSQFVEEQQPYDLMLRAGQQQQSAIDRVRSLASETRNKLQIEADPRLRGSYAIAKEREAQYQDLIEQDMKEFYESGNVRKAARKLTELNRQWQQDPIKRQVEKQSQRFREDIKSFREMRQKGEPVINKWMAGEDQFVSGLTEEGFYSPTVGVTKGVGKDQIREMFETEMDIKEQKYETKEGITTTVRPKEKMFKKVGLNEEGRLTSKGRESFQQWVADIGMEPLVDYMQRTGMIDETTSIDKLNERARDLYEQTAREVADRYYQFDLTREGGGDGDDEVSPFGADGFYKVNDQYNYSLPGFESVISTGFIRDIADMEEGTEKNIAANEIKAQIRGRGPEMSPELKVMTQVQKELASKGIFDSDAESRFATDPLKYNYSRLKSVLDKASRGIDLSDEEAEIAADLIGEKYMGGRQTIREIHRELTEDKANEILNDIQTVEGQNYQRVVKESKPKAIKNPEGWGIPYQERQRIANLNYGKTDVIDAEKGIQIKSDYIDRGDLKPRRILSLPLVKVNGRWVNYNEEDVPENIPQEQLKKRLFIEAEGKVDPTNLNPEEKLQMFTASENDISEETPISTQFEQNQEDIVKSNKMLIYVTDEMKQQILGSVENENMLKMFQNYQIPATEQAFGPSDVQSPNL